MKRKTIVVVGLTGALLAGVSLAALMSAEFLAPHKEQGLAVDIGRQAAPTPAQSVLVLPRMRVEDMQRVPAEEKTVTGNAVPSMALRSDMLAYDAAKPAAGFVSEGEIAAAPPPGTADEQYRDFRDNPVKLVAEEPVSTFSIDVDTAAYAVVRRYLKDGVLPPRDAVRTEELINYFDYDYALPDSPDMPFRADVALYDSPWDKGTQILRIGVQGYDIPEAARPPANIVFLVDTSGSMQDADKLPLLKQSLALLVDQMGEADNIAIVAYAGSAGVVLEPTRGSERRKIMAALDGFQASGGTAGAEGIRQAYALAESGFEKDAVNRVILATDGDFNVGIDDPERLADFIAEKRKTGVYLSILGFGRGNYNDLLMQRLAQEGNGNAAYIDTLMEARKVLVEEMGSTLFTIADDVKIQVEFNPAYVAEYRLIGYETRLLAREDFNNDHVDAGEIGSGHEVTALYEITPPGSASRLIDDLRYGPAAKPAPAGVGNGEVANLRLRWKRPGEATSSLTETPVLAAARTAFDAAPVEARFATAVAGFGQILRGAATVEGFTLDDVSRIARAARGEDAFGYRAEFIQLVGLAKSARAMETLN